MMEVGPGGAGGLELFLPVAALIASFLASTSGLPPVDNVLVEVKLEKELHLLSRNSTLSGNETKDNDTYTRPFQCVVNGLSKDELDLFAEGKNHNIIISTKSGTYSRFEESENQTGSSQPFNVELSVMNDSLVVKGYLRMERKSEDGVLVLDNEPITSCEVLFLEADKSNEESNENVTSRQLLVSGSESAPIITSDYDHVVLMNGAPEQVISCRAVSNPPPQMRWIIPNQNRSNAVTLSVDSYSENYERTIYLLFPQVNKKIKGNFTCVAENNYGRVEKIFEVDIISVESIAHCAGVSESPLTQPKTHAIIFQQNIHDILRRSKRHLWYQWRTTKLDPPSFSVKGDHNTDLQKMVNFIAERLQLADKVAVNKWDNGTPVEDLPREQQILENVVRQAQNRGLDPDWAHRFFRDQIEANKDVQYELIRTWQIHGQRPPGPPVDLGNEVRPEIDYINDQLLQLAKSTERERREWKCREEVEKNARYAAFVYNFDHLHQKTLQRATNNVCIMHLHHHLPVHLHPPPPPEFSDY